jgi:BirA family biotin operon repressor/biotin-[acetyl-CoA-carboxylase] ligase
MTPTQIVVLQRLAAARGVPVSGQELSRELGVSRAAISKAVDVLRGLGYRIDSSPRRGHRLAGRPDILLPFEIGDGLATEALGREVHHLTVTESTQDVARQLAYAGAPHGTIVIAEEQAAGRGRLGRAYWCPRGGIWCTLILRGPLPAAHAPLAGLAAGVAIAGAIAEETGLEPLLKWPNDVLLRGRKVAGVLTEMAAEEQSVQHLLVGAGLNANIPAACFPAYIAATATSLESECGGPVSRRIFIFFYVTGM